MAPSKSLLPSIGTIVVRPAVNASVVMSMPVSAVNAKFVSYFSVAAWAGGGSEDATSIRHTKRVQMYFIKPEGLKCFICRSLSPTDPIIIYYVKSTLSTIFCVYSLSLSTQYNLAQMFCFSLSLPYNGTTMKQTQLFTKTRKEAPRDEVSKNAQLLIRAGYIHKEMAGVYSYLPLGLRVLKKIENIIREEMNAIGGQEIEMTTLQDSEIWKKAGKWDDDKVDVWFKTHLKNGSELGLAFSHEEPLAEIVRNHVSSYKDLPLFIYQFQTKFRNELRAKSGIMRGREFLMKDMYSFTRTDDELMEFYEQSKTAYWNVMHRVGLEDYTYITRADGSVFGPWSDEFQVISDAGEDTIYIHKETKQAVNKEVYTPETLEKMNLDESELEEVRSIEAGNIFPIGTGVSETLNLTFTDESGNQQPIVMGSYGIGLGRLMGTVVEVLSDGKGIIWPESIAPFRVHVLSFGKDEEALDVYTKLTEAGIEVLLDDRDVSPGEKLADADLLGIPFRVVVSEKTCSEGKVEIKERSQEEMNLVSVEELISSLS